MAIMWLIASVPPFAVGLFGLTVIAGTLSTGLVGSIATDGTPAIPWSTFAAQFGSAPVVMTLAGMALAAGASKTAVDRSLANLLLARVLGRPRLLLITLMVSGAALSMFLSNTATAVLLLAIMAPLVERLGVRSNSARAMVLAAALGASIGGLATPIGTSPNIIAFSLLREEGHDITFGRWLLVGLPVAAIVLAVSAWWLLRLGGKFSSWREESPRIEPATVTRSGWACIVIFAITLCLWVTQTWTGIPVAVSSLLPLAALPMLGILGPNEIRSIDWSTLLLMGSGLCLGQAMEHTGLARWMVESTIPVGSPAMVLVAAFGMLAILLSTFMSNTATANLLMPMTLALPREELIVPCSLAAAIGSSLAISLPVSTPPMLLAYGTGMVRPPELLRLGLLIGAVGSVLTTLFVYTLAL
jgi:sodium-dependent dicarboxylate transporter 2/3/5